MSSECRAESEQGPSTAKSQSPPSTLHLKELEEVSRPIRLPSSRTAAPLAAPCAQHGLGSMLACSQQQPQQIQRCFRRLKFFHPTPRACRPFPPPLPPPPLRLSALQSLF
eukprot:364034-Chlamydomonas_euryale.AAC.11